MDQTTCSEDAGNKYNHHFRYSTCPSLSSRLSLVPFLDQSFTCLSKEKQYTIVHWFHIHFKLHEKKKERGTSHNAYHKTQKRAAELFVVVH